MVMMGLTLTDKAAVVSLFAQSDEIPYYIHITHTHTIHGTGIFAYIWLISSGKLVGNYTARPMVALKL